MANDKSPAPAPPPKPEIPIRPGRERIEDEKGREIGDSEVPVVVPTETPVVEES